MNVSSILSWVKSNLATVIFVIVMIVAIVTLPMVAANLNASVRSQMDDRIAMKKKLESLRKTSYTIQSAGLDQPISGSGVINAQFVAEFKRLIETERKDAAAVIAAATEHNRKGRRVIMDSVFPDPPERQRELVARPFAERLVSKYRQLLDSVNAGGPPAPKSVADTIERHRRSFYTNLQKEPGDALTNEEAARLTEYLSDIRLGEYRERSSEISFYATETVLGVPTYDNTVAYSMSELFDWQWNYWIIEDLLLALADANAKDQVARFAPVKRIVWLDLSASYEAKKADRGAAPSGGTAPGFGAVGGQPMGGNAEEDAGPTGKVPDPKVPVTLDYSASITGRTSNHLYDVRLVEMLLVVETSRIPEIIDAISERNFMTIIDMRLAERDAFADAAAGYFYGSAPVSEVRLTLETVWLRTWTSEFMPAEVRAQLGVRLPQAVDPNQDPNNSDPSQG